MADHDTYRTTVLVTGASGAIGRFVVPELLARGCRVVAVTRDAGGRKARPGLEWRELDIADTDRLEALIGETGARRVIHLAAALLNSERDIVKAIEVNVGGTASVFEAAARARIERVVHASSKAALGPLEGKWGHPDFEPVPEDHPRRPQSVYGLTKMLGEDVAEFYARMRGLEIISVRFGTSCGPGKGLQHGGAARLGHLIENALAGRPSIIEQGGEQGDDIMFTGEVAQGLVQICLAPGPLSGVLHLANDRVISLNELADAVRAELPEAEISIGPGLDYMGFGGIYCILDDRRAREEAGYAPRHDLKGWVRAYISHMRDQDEASGHDTGAAGSADQK